MNWLERSVADEFDELRSLSKDQKRMFATQARSRLIRRHPWRFGLFAVPCAALLVCVLASGPFVLEVLPIHQRYDIPVFALFMAYVTFWIALSMGIVYWMVRYWERLAIRDRIAAPLCSGCSFSLAGLPAQDAQTRCPECGTEQVVVGGN